MFPKIPDFSNRDCDPRLVKSPAGFIPDNLLNRERDHQRNLFARH